MPVIVAAIATTLAAGAPAFSSSPHPAQNIAPSPGFMADCAQHGAMSRACISKTVAAIDAARAQEPMRQRRLILPASYQALSPAEQAFVIINLERVDRSLRPIKGMVARLNHDAQASAAVGADPHPGVRELRRLGVRAYRTIFARDYGVLAADYEWMYNDGYSAEPGGTTNANCPSPDSAGCWGHRAGILDPFTGLRRLIGGMGEAEKPDGASMVTAILAGGHRPVRHYTYTWREALSDGADGTGSA